MKDWLPVWLTIDRTIAIAAATGAVIAAALSLWAVLLTRRAQTTQEKAKLPVLVFGVDPKPNAKHGWHYATVHRSRREPMHFYFLNISVGRGFTVVQSIENPEPSVPGQPRYLLIPSSETPSRTLAGWSFRVGDDDAEEAIFFLRPSGTVWRRRSSRVSLRLTLEEMSPARRRMIMTIKSNVIDWKASAATRTD
jgi:hypothetical protein